MSPLKTHKDLDVWNGAVHLARDVYELTGSYPREEIFGLVSQMRRASVSIASNIAEGAARQGSKEFLHFLYIAAGSASELETQLEISRRVGLGSPQGLTNLEDSVNKVRQMLHGLIRSVKERRDP